MAHEFILCVLEPVSNLSKNTSILPCFKTKTMKAGLSFVSGHDHNFPALFAANSLFSFFFFFLCQCSFFALYSPCHIIPLKSFVSVSLLILAFFVYFFPMFSLLFLTPLLSVQVYDVSVSLLNLAFFIYFFPTFSLLFLTPLVSVQVYDVYVFFINSSICYLLHSYVLVAFLIML